MEKFVLKVKDGEVINVTYAYDIEGAIECFAIVKNLSISELMKIFNVEMLTK